MTSAIMSRVVTVEINGEAKAYPINILVWHEIVNDTIGGVAGDGHVFARFAIPPSPSIVASTAPSMTLVVSGNLRYSDLIMYDRQTESWWQQITGMAIVGELTGKRLTPVPASMVSFADFRSTHPGSVVLSRETGFLRPYGENPVSRL